MPKLKGKIRVAYKVLRRVSLPFETAAQRVKLTQKTDSYGTPYSKRDFLQELLGHAVVESRD
mgnify:CR=1 FL=1